ncbi:MAG TPA: ABC transporter ATP-binding protein [Acidimicrobiia bacterium]|nr:ABC transporter ATP-binding protein [Acidimicrobiia bacterium]
MTSITARSLSKSFGPIDAVVDLSFDVGPGEVVGLLGANGAGKTTTMRILLGLLAPTSGEVLIGGQVTQRIDRHVIGYVPQGLGLYRDLTVAENLSFAAAAFGVPTPSLTEEDLEEFADRRVGEISLGLRRRLAFVVARCHQPSVLILDEPTSGVGPLGRARLWETVHETAQDGAAVLVSTHHMEEAEECDRVILMSAGREIASGSVADVIGGAYSVSVSGDVSDAALRILSETGGTVLVSGEGWRVVGLDSATVTRIVGPDGSVERVPASFEEAFVALSR